MDSSPGSGACAGDLRRAWHIGEVFALVLGAEVAPRGWKTVDVLIDYLAGMKLSGDERRAAALAAHNWLVRHFPDLANFDSEDVPSPEFRDLWLRRRIAEFGEYISIPRPPADNEVAQAVHSFRRLGQ